MLLGAVVVAAVLHVGLSRIAQTIAASHATLERTQAALVALPQQQPASPAPAVNPILLQRDRDARVRDGANSAIQPQLAALNGCLRGKHTSVGLPFPLEIKLKFDAQGRETSREYNLPMAGSPPEVVGCLRGLKLPPLQVPAPGFEATTTVGL